MIRETDHTFALWGHDPKELGDYQMTKKRFKSIPHVFLSAPFTGALGKRGDFDPELRSQIEKIAEAVRHTGTAVFSAHEYEHWGRSLSEATMIISGDLKELRKSSHMIAYFCKIHSAGVLLEVGLGIALGIPILAVIEPGGWPRSDFFQGLVKSGVINVVSYVSNSTIRNAIRDFLGSKTLTAM